MGPRPEGKGQRAKFAGGFRRDAFGFMDVLAFRPERMVGGYLALDESGLETPSITLAVQCTTKRQVSDHLRAYRRDPEVRRRILNWIACGHAFVIHGWWKEDVPNKAGTGTYVRWRVEERQVTPKSLELTPADVEAIAKAKLTSAPAKPKGE